jgi:ABC-2 type transport system ATP-binding protein
VATLSGGWQRRVNFAAGVVHSPSVLILDEPTAGLDVEARAEVHGVIRRLSREGVAVLLTSHLFEEMGALSDRVGILHMGRLVREGTVATLTGALRVRQVAYLESPEPARVRAVADEAGWKVSEVSGRLAVELTRKTDLASIVQRLHGVPLKSVALEPVSLAHVYMDAVAGGI